VWADVPWLPSATPIRLAEIAQEDPAVEALRLRARRAFTHAKNDDLDRTAAELADELSEAARDLEDEIRSAKLWGLVRSAPFSAVSVGLGATTGVVSGLAGVAAGIGSALPAVGQLQRAKRKPAYALVLAKRSAT
jgi:hypothetical protein